MCGVTRQQKREADSDFHSSARLIRRCDIAVAKWSNATVSARIYRVLSAMDDAAA